MIKYESEIKSLSEDVEGIDEKEGEGLPTIEDMVRKEYLKVEIAFRLQMENTS